MKNKKGNGFTLIELLAIIVILAIIAVITVPVILNIIEKSKRGAAISSAHGFKDAVYKYYASESIDTELELDGEYTVANGLINGSGFENTIIPVSGTKPSSGVLNYSEGNFINGWLVIGDYTVTFELNGDVTVLKSGDIAESSELDSEAEQLLISEKVDSYVKAALSANSSLPGEIAKTVSEMSEVTTDAANSGWIHFNKVNDSVVVVDYSLTYGTITANYSSLTNDKYVSTFGSSRNKPTLFKGDSVCYGPTESRECFTIISMNAQTTLLLANYELKKITDNSVNPATVTYKQDSLSPDYIAFSNNTNANYWHDSTNAQPKTNYAKDVNGNAATYSGNPYPYIYDSNSNTYEYVEGYLTLLKTQAYGLPSNASGRLLAVEEVNNVSMFADASARANGKSYWLGSTFDDSYVRLINDYGSLDYTGYYYACGIRPVIIVSTSDIQ